MVMLTTDGLPKLVERGRALGAKAWLMKPLKPEQLLPLVRKIAGDPALSKSA
jgi:two-component system chemotaxis response regulator CheY